MRSRILRRATYQFSEARAGWESDRNWLGVRVVTRPYSFGWFYISGIRFPRPLPTNPLAFLNSRKLHSAFSVLPLCGSGDRLPGLLLVVRKFCDSESPVSICLLFAALVLPVRASL
ncbi:unnamed protein product [Spirodela intermedia]|uniref:Uncharacterized protein n=1 Tax=Spirodela intermedia TaxID=51605 RepID=A0A7I8IHD1_SPIIN|nr:unnamed protein product [Spirodela intermedia]CAA6657272.1 unnamed protein product [Spirodela intermedia]